MIFFWKPLGFMSGIFSCLVKDCRLIKAMDVVNDDDDDDDDDDDGGLLLFSRWKICSQEKSSNNFTRYSQASFGYILTSTVNYRLVNLASFTEPPSFKQWDSMYTFIKSPKPKVPKGQRLHKKGVSLWWFSWEFGSEIWHWLSWKKISRCWGDRQRFGRGRWWRNLATSTIGSFDEQNPEWVGGACFMNKNGRFFSTTTERYNQNLKKFTGSGGVKGKRSPAESWSDEFDAVLGKRWTIWQWLWVGLVPFRGS